MLQYNVTLARLYHFFKRKTLGFMEIRVNKIPPVCGRGGGRGWIRHISIPLPISLDFIQDRASH